MASVWPAHACGTLRTLTWVTLPLLSTLRVAVSDEEVQPVTVTLPAPSFPEVRPRLAAEATPTTRSAAVSAMPKILVSRFTHHHLPTGSQRGAEMAPRSLIRRYGDPCLRDDDRDAGDGARVDVPRRRDVRGRARRGQRARHLRADRGARGACELDPVRLAQASRGDAREVHLAHGVAGQRRAVRGGVGGVNARAAGRDDGVARAEARRREAERGGEAVHAGEDDGCHNRSENELCRPRGVPDLAHVEISLVSFVPAGQVCPVVRRSSTRL